MKKTFVRLLLLSLTWSGYFLCSQFLGKSISVFSTGAIIRIISFSLLIIFLSANKQLNVLQTPNGAKYRLIIIGVVCFLLDGAACIGFNHCEAGTGTALLKCDVLFVNLLSVILNKKRLGTYAWIGTILMLIGVVIMLDIDISELKIDNFYYFMFIISAFLAACNAFVIKGTQKRYPEINDIAIVAYNIFFSGICFLLAALAKGSFLSDGKTIFNGGTKGIVVCIIGGICNVTTLISYYNCLRKYPVWLVKLSVLTMPVFSAVISYFCFGDILSVKQIIGIVIICIVAAFMILGDNAHSIKESQAGY